MSVRQELLKLFEDNIDVYLSGEQIASSLGCSRGAVWKAVKALHAEGYAIKAATNRGYLLSGETDVLSGEAIMSMLKPDIPECDVRIYKTVDSTNTELRRLSDGGAAEWTTVIAETQTEGKGRLDRRFYSPGQSGLYMSVLLKPRLSPEKSVRITTAAAVAVAEAIESVLGKEVGIKWVNDLFFEGRKICGILTEAVYSMENNEIASAILGIGVDLYKPQEKLSDDVVGIMGNLLENKKWSARNMLAAEILKHFRRYYDTLEQGIYMDGYRQRLLYKGERVTVISGSGNKTAELVGVDGECRLIVRYDDGSEAALCSGEISVKREGA